MNTNQRGAVGRGCLIAGVVGLVIVGLIAMTAIGSYNSMVGSQEKVSAAWAEIDNQYKRRFDLIPNLVETVKGAAEFEQSTLQAVVDARAAVGRVQLPETLPTDPAKLDAYLKAQQSLGGALGRLFAVAENYPQLKATQNYLSLQDQLEGTENRIAVARRDYIESVRTYNTTLRTFPTNLLAGVFGFETAAQPTVEAEERAVPKVDFGDGK
jgi:LemA protein